MAYEENLESRGGRATEKGEDRFIIATYRVEGMSRFARHGLDDVIAPGSEFVPIGFEGLGR